jgi:hypothetical protein
MRCFPRGEGDDTNTPIFRALDPGCQALREETVHKQTGIPHFDNKWRIEETVLCNGSSASATAPTSPA